MKNAFDGLGRLITIKERISEFEDMLIETSQAEKKNRREYPDRIVVNNFRSKGNNKM